MAVQSSPPTTQTTSSHARGSGLNLRQFIASHMGQALFTALISILLALPLLGVRMVNQGGALSLNYRLESLIMIGVFAFMLRLAWLWSTQRKFIGMSLFILVLFALPLFFSLLPEDTQSFLAPFLPLELQVFLQLGAAVLSIRMLLLLGQNSWQRLPILPGVIGRLRQTSSKQKPLLLWLALAIAFILPFLPIDTFIPAFGKSRLIDTAILVVTYIMLGWGLNIVVGLAGLLDLGYVAFYAIGAYSYALLAIHFDLSFWVCLPLAGVFAALGGLILGFPVLRLRGDYFAIVTLGFGEIIRLVLINWYQFTGGPDGINNVPSASFFGLAEFTRRPDEGETAFHVLFGLEYSSLHKLIFYYYLILLLALLVNWFSLRIRRLPIGRAWEALREDEIACHSLGINRRNIKLAAFTISAMFGGFAGSFFATRQNFISPESFTFLESVLILAIVVLGGMGSQIGVVLAAILLIGLPEIFREFAQYRMLVFGAAMVAIMIWRPRGLLAHRNPTIYRSDIKRTPAP